MTNHKSSRNLILMVIGATYPMQTHFDSLVEHLCTKRKLMTPSYLGLLIGEAILCGILTTDGEGLYSYTTEYKNMLKRDRGIDLDDRFEQFDFTVDMLLDNTLAMMN